MTDYSLPIRREVARLIGLAVRTLHHYEEIRLLQPGRGWGTRASVPGLA